MRNIQSIEIGATTPAKSTTVLVSGNTHAAYIQQVNVTLTDANKNVTNHTFQGTGEGARFSNPMYVKDVPLPARIDFEFMYSSDGGSNFEPANFSEQSELVNQPEIQVYSLFSEDATDKDDNDSYMVASFHHGS